MAVETVFGILIVALCVLMIGASLFFRGRFKRDIESSTGQGEFRFNNCYDLCRRDPKLAGEGCATMCSYGWP